MELAIVAREGRGWVGANLHFFGVETRLAAPLAYSEKLCWGLSRGKPRLYV
jgi:hypothetical protein